MVTKSRQQGAVSVVGGNLMVDCYVCWQIPPTTDAQDQSVAEDYTDRPVVKFLRSVRTTEGAEARLEKLILSKLGNEIAQIQLTDLLDTRNAGTALDDTSEIRSIGRRVADSLGSLEKDAGIKIVDVQIKRLKPS